jgi:hypothetical protein
MIPKTCIFENLGFFMSQKFVGTGSSLEVFVVNSPVARGSSSSSSSSSGVSSNISSITAFHLGPSSWLFLGLPDNPSNFQGPQEHYEALKSLLRPIWAQETLVEGSSRPGRKVTWFDGLARDPREESEGQEDQTGVP